MGQRELGRLQAAAEAERAAAAELDAAALRLVRRQRVSLQVTGGEEGEVVLVLSLFFD